MTLWSTRLPPQPRTQIYFTTHEHKNKLENTEIEGFWWDLEGAESGRAGTNNSFTFPLAYIVVNKTI